MHRLVGRESPRDTIPTCNSIQTLNHEGLTLGSTLMMNINNTSGPPISHITISECARRLGVAPRHISDLFYQRLIADELAPIQSGRRLIPEGQLHVIARELRRAGKLPPIKEGLP